MASNDLNHGNLRETRLVEHREAEPDARLDEAAATKAAEALRQAELEAVDPEVSRDAPPLESMNIDELRDLAKQLDVPDRATIIDRDELIAAIRARL